MLKCKQIISGMLITVVLLSQNICNVEAKSTNSNETIQTNIVTEEQGAIIKDNATYIETVSLGNDIECDVYEVVEAECSFWGIPEASVYASETFLPVTHYFYLRVNSTDIGYLRQTTNWYYNGSTRPRFTGTPSDTLCIYDTITDSYRMVDGGYTVLNYSTLSKIYTRTASLERNGVVLETNGFSTIVNSTGSTSFVVN